MRYARGGKDSKFTGTAEFVELDGGDGRSRLAYREEGEVTLQPERTRLSAAKRLIYDFGVQPEDHGPVRVFFDEADSREPADVLQSARFFHDISLGAGVDEPPPFRHPCGPDMYTGVLSISARDHFVMTWDVEGPRKSGTVISRYERHT